jgi:hypothetical protein
VVCESSEATKQTSLLPGTAKTLRFDITDPCLATGVRLSVGAKCRITFTHPTNWHDGAIDVANLAVRLPSGEARPHVLTEGYGTFERTVPRYMAFGMPMRCGIEHSKSVECLLLKQSCGSPKRRTGSWANPTLQQPYPLNYFATFGV